MTKKINPDLVLMDILMPVMDGFKSANYIKQMFPKIPIVAITASIMEFQDAKHSKADFDDFYGKPISKRQLLEILNRYIKR